MKLISARASRAPAPMQHREARAGHPRRRARSRGCRAPAPRSQCGFGVKSNVARLAVRRTLDVVLGRRRPTGTLACGRFGSAQQDVRALRARSPRARRRAALICVGLAAWLASSSGGRRPRRRAWPSRSPRPPGSARASAPRARGRISRRRLVERRPARRSAGSRPGPRVWRPLPDRLEVVAKQSRVEHGCILWTRCGSTPLGKAPPTSCYPCPVNATVRKAVFPAAGLGTRFLPATKAQPKEMLPLVDKPIIQYGVEEALASGVDNIILVTGRGKNAIEDHFDVIDRARDVPRGARQARAARRDPQDLEPDQLRLRPPGRAARPRPRRAGDRARWSATSRSR